MTNIANLTVCTKETISKTIAYKFGNIATRIIRDKTNGIS